MVHPVSSLSLPSTSLWPPTVLCHTPPPLPFSSLSPLSLCLTADPPMPVPGFKHTHKYYANPAYSVYHTSQVPIQSSSRLYSGVIVYMPWYNINLQCSLYTIYTITVQWIHGIRFMHYSVHVVQ